MLLAFSLSETRPLASPLSLILSWCGFSPRIDSCRRNRWDAPTWHDKDQVVSALPQNFEYPNFSRQPCWRSIELSKALYYKHCNPQPAVMGIQKKHGKGRLDKWYKLAKVRYIFYTPNGHIINKFTGKRYLSAVLSLFSHYQGHTRTDN